MTPELEARIRLILGKLALLSEAPAGRPPDLSPPVSGGTDEKGRKHKRRDPTKWAKSSASAPPHADSAPPPGVNNELRRTDPNRPPDKERSLHDWYEWQFRSLLEGPPSAAPTRRGEDEPSIAALMENLCEAAELEYEERRYRSPEADNVRSGLLTDNVALDGGAAERSAARRVVEWYEGKPSIWVAQRERTTVAWVEKARREHKRRPRDGRPRPGFLDLDEEGRRQAVARLAAKEVGQKTAADKLRVSKSTVQRYWPEDLAAAA